MTFVSYAQNFEDVMLWRALKNVENGFYIDVGANDPVVDSVTQSFYDRGWRGINIEPLLSHHKALVEERPEDVNLLCAAGSVNGEVEIWECDVRGWATVNPKVIAQHSANGHHGVFHRVPVAKLADICDEHAPDEIHFLKIDVEGFEKSVIEGMDFSRHRPWILVVEATRPSSSEMVYHNWEEVVLAANYLHAYSDGLNRFYVASEHPGLRNSLRYPPNVFDDFVRFEQLSVESKAQQAEARAQQAEVKAQQAEVKAQQAEAKAQQAEAKAQQAETASYQTSQQLQAVYASGSWRITAPLRLAAEIVVRLASTLRRLANLLLRQAIGVFQRPLAFLMRWALRNRRLTARINRLLMRFPHLHRQLLDVARARGVLPGVSAGIAYRVSRPVVRSGNWPDSYYLGSRFDDGDGEMSVEEALNAIRVDLRRFRGCTDE